MYQTKFWVDDTNTYQVYGVPIGNAKITRKVRFHPTEPLIKYHQNTSNSYCLGSLELSFHCIDENWAVSALVNIIKEPLNLQTDNFKNRIHFVNDIMTNKRKMKV